MLGTRSHGRGPEWAEEPQGRWQLALSCTKARSRPELALHDMPHMSVPELKTTQVLYSSTEGRGGVPALSSSRSELPQGGFPGSALQALPGAPLSPRAGRRSSLQKQPQGAEQRWPGQAGGRSTSIWGETSTSPRSYIKASALGNGESPTLKTRNTS